MERNWFNDPLAAYTAVGSRETPEKMLTLQFHFGRVMCDIGVQGWSGLADGSDVTYFEGAKQSKRFDEIGFINFIPWDGFSSSATSIHKHYSDPDKGILNFDRSPFKMRAWTLGIGARGSDNGLFKCDRLSKIRGGHSLHGRNAHEVLGPFLDKKSRFVHCWAKPIGRTGKVQGGTGTAVSLAKHFGIKVVNLATPEGLEWTLNFLKNHGVDLNYDDFKEEGR